MATKICIVGAGAIGGSIAARIAANTRHEVSVLARGKQLDAIQRNGLTLIVRGRRVTVPVRASSDPAALGPHDIVILALKAYSLAAVAPGLAPLLRPDTVIVPVQNGVPWWYFYQEGGKLDGARLDAIDPDGALWTALDPRQVVGAVTYAGATVPEPGVIDLSYDETMVFGEPDGTRSARLERVAGLFRDAGFKTETTEAIRKTIWLKLWGNATVNPVSILAHTTVDRLIEDALVKQTLTDAMIEIQAIAGKLGIVFDVTLEQRFVQTAGLGAFRTSMLQDLEAGRPLEIDALVGVVVELAHKLDVRAPVIETLHALARLRGNA
jgi:2-dehydropantoate 2-reductase